MTDQHERRLDEHARRAAAGWRPSTADIRRLRRLLGYDRTEGRRAA